MSTNPSSDKSPVTSDSGIDHPIEEDLQHSNSSVSSKVSDRINERNVIKGTDKSMNKIPRELLGLCIDMVWCKESDTRVSRHDRNKPVREYSNNTGEQMKGLNSVAEDSIAIFKGSTVSNQGLCTPVVTGDEFLESKDLDVSITLDSDRLTTTDTGIKRLVFSNQIHLVALTLSHSKPFQFDYDMILKPKTQFLFVKSDESKSLGDYFNSSDRKTRISLHNGIFMVQSITDYGFVTLHRVRVVLPKYMSVKPTQTNEIAANSQSENTSDQSVQTMWFENNKESLSSFIFEDVALHIEGSNYHLCVIMKIISADNYSFDSKRNRSRRHFNNEMNQLNSICCSNTPSKFDVTDEPLTDYYCLSFPLVGGVFKPVLHKVYKNTNIKVYNEGLLGKHFDSIATLHDIIMYTLEIQKSKDTMQTIKTNIKELLVRFCCNRDLNNDETFNFECSSCLSCSIAIQLLNLDGYIQFHKLDKYNSGMKYLDGSNDYILVNIIEPFVNMRMVVARPLDSLKTDDKSRMVDKSKLKHTPRSRINLEYMQLMNSSNSIDDELTLDSIHRITRRMVRELHSTSTEPTSGVMAEPVRNKITKSKKSSATSETTIQTSEIRSQSMQNKKHTHIKNIPPKEEPNSDKIVFKPSVRLEISDSKSGFKYIGFCIKYSPCDKDPMLKKDRMWKYAVIKYWDPNCKAFFAHCIDESLYIDSHDEREIIHKLKTLDSIYSDTVLWLTTQHTYVLVVCDNIFDRNYHLGRKLVQDISDKDTPLNDKDLNKLCQVCRKPVYYIRKDFSTPVSKIRNTCFDREIPFAELIGMLKSTYDYPNALFLNPLHDTISALRGLEKYTEKTITSLLENNLDIATIILGNYKRELIDVYDKYSLFFCINIIIWLRKLCGIKTTIQSDTNLKFVYWGLKCVNCNNVYHAKCLQFQHFRKPVPRMTVGNVLKRLSHHRYNCSLFKKTIYKRDSFDDDSSEQSEDDDPVNMNKGTVFQDITGTSVKCAKSNGNTSNSIDDDTVLLLPLSDCTDESDVWTCKDCTTCVYCCLPLKEDAELRDFALIESVFDETTSPKGYRNYPPSFDDKLDRLQRNQPDTERIRSVKCVSCNLSAHRACCNPVVPSVLFIESWKCDWCSQCISCGYRDQLGTEYVNWGLFFLLCLKCWESLEKSNYCGVCYKVWTNHDSITQRWIQCEGCKLWIHIECDELAQSIVDCTTYKNQNYRCKICRYADKMYRCMRLLEFVFLIDKANQFRYPVSPTCVIYWRIVTIPMNLITLLTKLKDRSYESINEFIFDIFLIPYNAKMVNMPNTKIYKFASIFERKCKQVASNIMQLSISEIEVIFNNAIKGGDVASRESKLNQSADKIHESLGVANLDYVAKSRDGTSQNGTDDLYTSNLNNGYTDSTYNGINYINVKSIKSSYDCFNITIDKLIFNTLGLSDICDVYNTQFFHTSSFFVPCGLRYTIVSILPHVGQRINIKGEYHPDEVYSVNKKRIVLSNNIDGDSIPIYYADENFLDKISEYYFTGLNNGDNLWDEFCIVCGSSSYQSYMVYCICCGESVHYFCIGFAYPPPFASYENFRCSACSKCDDCKGEIQLNHTYELSNILDLQFGNAMGWISNYVANNIFSRNRYRMYYYYNFEHYYDQISRGNTSKYVRSRIRTLNSSAHAKSSNKQKRPKSKTNATQNISELDFNAVDLFHKLSLNTAPLCYDESKLQEYRFPLISTRCIICGFSAHLKCMKESIKRVEVKNLDNCANEDSKMYKDGFSIKSSSRNILISSRPQKMKYDGHANIAFSKFVQQNARSDHASLNHRACLDDYMMIKKRDRECLQKYINQFHVPIPSHNENMSNDAGQSICNNDGKRQKTNNTNLDKLTMQIPVDYSLKAFTSETKQVPLLYAKYLKRLSCPISYSMEQRNSKILGSNKTSSISDLTDTEPSKNLTIVEVNALKHGKEFLEKLTDMGCNMNSDRPYKYAAAKRLFKYNEIIKRLDSKSRNDKMVLNGSDSVDRICAPNQINASSSKGELDSPHDDGTDIPATSSDIHISESKCMEYRQPYKYILYSDDMTNVKGNVHTFDNDGKKGLKWEYDGSGLFTCGIDCKHSLSLLKSSYSYPHQYLFIKAMFNQRCGFGIYNYAYANRNYENCEERPSLTADPQHIIEKRDIVSIILNCSLCGTLMKKGHGSRYSCPNNETTLARRMKGVIIPLYIPNYMLCNFCKLWRKANKGSLSLFLTESTKRQIDKLGCDGEEELLNRDDFMIEHSDNSNSSLSYRFMQMLTSNDTIKTISLIRYWILLSENIIHYATSIISTIIPKDVSKRLVVDILRNFVYSSSFVSNGIHSSAFASMINSPLSPITFNYWIHSLLNAHLVNCGEMALAHDDFRPEHETKIDKSELHNTDINENNDGFYIYKMHLLKKYGLNLFSNPLIKYNPAKNNDRGISTFIDPIAGFDQGLMNPCHGSDLDVSDDCNLSDNSNEIFKRKRITTSHYILIRRYTNAVASCVQFFRAYRDLLSYKIFLKHLDYNRSNINEASAQIIRRSTETLRKRWKRFLSCIVNYGVNKIDTNRYDKRYPYLRRHLAHLIFSGETYYYEDNEYDDILCISPSHLYFNKKTASPSFILGKVACEGKGILHLLSVFNKFLKHEYINQSNSQYLHMSVTPISSAKKRLKPSGASGSAKKNTDTQKDKNNISNAKLDQVTNEIVDERMMDDLMPDANIIEQMSEPLEMNLEKEDKTTEMSAKISLDGFYNTIEGKRSKIDTESRSVSKQINDKVERMVLKRLGYSLLVEVVGTRASVGDVIVESQADILHSGQLDCSCTLNNLQSMVDYDHGQSKDCNIKTNDAKLSYMRNTLPVKLLPFSLSVKNKINGVNEYDGIDNEMKSEVDVRKRDKLNGGYDLHKLTTEKFYKCSLCLISNHTLLRGSLIPWRNGYIHSECLLWSVGTNHLPRTFNFNYREFIFSNDPDFCFKDYKQTDYTSNLNEPVQERYIPTGNYNKTLNLLYLPILPQVQLCDSIVYRMTLKSVERICIWCNNKGASIKCSGPDCSTAFHLLCLYISVSKIAQELSKQDAQLRGIFPIRMVFTMRMFWCNSCFNDQVSSEIGKRIRSLFNLNKTVIKSFISLEGMTPGAVTTISKQIIQSVRIIPKFVHYRRLKSFMSKASKFYHVAQSSYKHCMCIHPLERRMSYLIDNIIKPRERECYTDAGMDSPGSYGVTECTRIEGNLLDECDFTNRYFLYGKNSIYVNPTFASQTVPYNDKLNYEYSNIIRVGSLTILNIGDTLLFDDNNILFPIGFTSVRIFWNENYFNEHSPYGHLNSRNRNANSHYRNPQRSAYICTIRLKDSLPLFSIDLLSPQIGGSKRLAQGTCINSVFDSFLNVIGSKKCHISATAFFGLDLHVVLQELRVVLAVTFMRRVSQFLKMSAFEESILGNKPCKIQARLNRNIRLGEYRYDTPFKIKKRDLEDLISTTLDFKESEAPDSDNRGNRVRSIKQYTNNSAMQYRYLISLPPEKRLDVKTSAIHGLGLFATEDIAAGEPVVEYVGELIRDIISDKREEMYSKGQGGDGSCYMFRLDEQLIVDATRKGNMSRFINHSCDPNCICRIITCENGLKHIVVFSKCDLKAGDEVTYDYQFGIESETRKLQCLCGAPNCLGRMN